MARNISARNVELKNSRSTSAFKIKRLQSVKGRLKKKTAAAPVKEKKARRDGGGFFIVCAARGASCLPLLCGLNETNLKFRSFLKLSSPFAS